MGTQDQKEVGQGNYQDGLSGCHGGIPKSEDIMKLGKALMITLALFLGMDAMAGNLQRLHVTEASPETRMKAVETFYGDVISVDRVINLQQPVDLGKIMKSQQLELSDGQIFYPEEVEYLIDSKGPRALEKAPHTPD